MTIAAQQVRCFELRLTGMSIRGIAAATGLSVGTVHGRISREIRAQVTPLADELRVIELARLDAWLKHLNSQIEAGYAVARNIEVGLRLSERRSKLLGLDAPTLTRVETITMDHIESEITRLEAELGASGGSDD